MKKNYMITALMFAFVLFGTSNSWAQVETFSYTGGPETYTVPADVYNIEIEAWGAQAGDSEACGGIIDIDGGLGGYSIGVLEVTPGDVLNIYVGGQPELIMGAGSAGGYNGGGASGQYAGAGGGASDVRVDGTDLTDRIIVAGGGGGGNTGCPNQGTGGAGGGLSGEAGISLEGHAVAGGGTDIAGGAGSGSGSDGEFGVGGTGLYHVAGGGGGYYGGGAGFATGAGGGSSFIDGVTDGATTAGVRAGHGEIVITELCSEITVSMSADPICVGVPFTLLAEGVGTIEWDGGIVNGEPFTPLSEGVFTYVSSSDSYLDCEYIIDVEVLISPELTFSTTEEVYGGEGSIDITVTGGVPGYTFDWDNDETGDFDDDEDLTGLAGGTYTIVVMAENGCTVTEAIVVSSQVSISNESDTELVVYPNPASTFITIQEDGQFNFEILSINGEVVIVGQGVNSEKVNVSNFANGIYFVNIKVDGEIRTLKLVKE